MGQGKIFAKDNIFSFQQHIFNWWQKNKRDLPWRHTRDPYKILVSELMLQQTQVARVLPKYEEFLGFFPNVESLAQASTANVLKAWKGMGYNRRALYLKKTAEIVVQKHHGVFLQQEKELLELPGLGTYTARALLVFAYQQDVAMVDTNIRQIITHHFFADLPQKESVIHSVADQLVPKGKSWEWHQALMDYGAICLPSLKAYRPERSRRTTLEKVTQSRLPFRQTNRFIRGRIIDQLRERNIQEETLIEAYVVEYNREKALLIQIIEGLIADHLIVRESTLLRLPD